jgi:Mn2+/Fe2+ NRAMP family transporter
MIWVRCYWSRAFTPKIRCGPALNEVMLLIIAIVGTTVAPW